MDQDSTMGGGNPGAMPNSFQNAATDPFAAPTAPTSNFSTNVEAAQPAPAIPNPVAAPGATPVMPAMPNPTMANPAMNPAMAASTPAKKNTGLIETLVLIGVCLIAAAAIVFAVIFFVQYNELKTNFDEKKNIAVADAIKQTQDDDAAAFKEQEKTPFYSFTGPSDYGSISFEYPKTWSVYVDSDGTKNSDFKAYFRPSQVDPVNDRNSRYALRFQIVNRQISSIQTTYENKVKNGKMTSRVFNADNNSLTGTWYEGEIETNLEGIIVLVKVNDKTAIFQMDAEPYRADFETLMGKLRRNS